MPPNLVLRDGNLVPADWERAQIAQGWAVFNRARLRWELADEIKDDPNMKNNLPHAKYPVFEPTHRVQPLRLDYENEEELVRRIVNTIIIAKDAPYFVEQCTPNRLVLQNSKERFQLETKKAMRFCNLRSVPPGYISFNGEAVMLQRQPIRQYQQGLTLENTFLLPVNKKRHIRLDNLLHLLPALEDRRVLQLTPDMPQKSTRLSNAVAVYQSKKKNIVEYKGRCLGHLRGNLLIPEQEEDIEPHWVQRDLAEVGIHV